uniref:Synaptobrevin, longin-like domain protein n=1 Tax=Tanacetum cinerariifolium TaxID=118510 RepID=A0A699GJU0_TANCI|nr:hypothetical protein [Tanacetum cinerariifolium]
MLYSSQQMVFNSPCLTHKKELIHHEGLQLTHASCAESWNGYQFTIDAVQELASPEANDFCDSPLLGVNTPRSDEDRLKLMELMVFLLQRIVCVEIGKVRCYCGFEQIIDFLSGSYINHALTVNPHVYISCIKQFWNTAVVKRLGVICLPNEEIFSGLARMGYEKPSTKLTFYKAFFSTQWKFFIYNILHSLSVKRTSWNEFSLEMASALICLSSGQRYISPVLTQKVFANMRRVRKGFLGVETPLFESTLAVKNVAEEAEAQVPAQGDDVQEPITEEVVTDQVLDTCSALALRVESLENDKAAQQLEIFKLKARVKKLEKINKVKSSKLRRLKKDERIELVADQEKDAEVEGRHADKQAEIYNIYLDHSSKVLSMQEDDTEVVATSTPIPAAKPKILKIAAASAVSTKRRKGVVIRDPEEGLPYDIPAETPNVKDKGKGILIEAPKPIKKKDQIEMDAEYPLSRFTMEQLVNVAGLQVKEESEMSLELLRLKLKLFKDAAAVAHAK